MCYYDGLLPKGYEFLDDFGWALVELGDFRCLGSGVQWRKWGGMNVSSLGGVPVRGVFYGEGPVVVLKGGRGWVVGWLVWG